MDFIKKIADFLQSLTWWVLLILVILFDGFVGGVIRIANGKQTLSKAVGWILLVSFILSLVSFLPVPAIIANISRIVYIVCLIADIITVALYKKIILLLL